MPKVQDVMLVAVQMVQGVRERCRGDAGGAGAVQEVQGRCRLPAPSAPPRALCPVQGGAGGAGTPQQTICCPQQSKGSGDRSGSSAIREIQPLAVGEQSDEPGIKPRLL